MTTCISASAGKRAAVKFSLASSPDISARARRCERERNHTFMCTASLALSRRDYKLFQHCAHCGGNSRLSVACNGSFPRRAAIYVVLQCATSSGSIFSIYYVDSHDLLFMLNGSRACHPFGACVYQHLEQKHSETTGGQC
jgi:hypothetical protein